MNSEINILRIFFVSLVVALLVSSCISTPTQLPAPKKVKAVTTTPIPTRSSTRTPTPKSTLIPLPLQKNPVLISYTKYSGDGADEIIRCLGGFDNYTFVLYQDGRVMVFHGSYLTAVISQSEIDKLLSDIEATSFFSVNGNGDQYIDDAPTPYPSGWSWGNNITVKDKSISLRGDISPDYEVEAIKKTRQIIDDFEPPNLEPYRPNSILVWVTAISDTSFDSYNPRPFPPRLHWSSDMIQLNAISVDSVKVVSGNSLDFIMQQVKAIPDYRMVEQDGQYYLVAACPNFDNFK